jgi:hypothetical protein
MPSPPTISQLFTPLASGVVNGVTPGTVATNTWLFNELTNGNTLGLPVTAWQSGGVAWTELMIWALGYAQSDAVISLHAQAAFLDYCATGSVSYTNAQGVAVTVPVTPDPSIPAQNPTGALGWLDVLSDGLYNVDRNVATFAAGNLYLVNSGTSGAGTYAPLGFHALNGSTGATYSNQVTFTASVSTTAGGTVSSIGFSTPPSVTTTGAHGLSTGAIVWIGGGTSVITGLASNTPGSAFATITVTGPTTFTLSGWSSSGGSYAGVASVYIPQSVTFAADLIGPSSNAGPGQVNATTTSVPGVFVWNQTALSGSPYESNIALASRCKNKLGSLSLNGPKGAYAYAALTSSQLLAAQTPAKTLTSAVTKETDSSSLANGVVTVTVANSTGPVLGVAQLAVTGATGNGVSPIVLVVGSSTGVTAGMVVLVTGVQGNTAANGYWTVTIPDGTHISLTGSTGNGAYTQGGAIEAGDIGLIDSIVQAYAVPNGVTAVTQSAVALNVTVTGNVYVPVAFLSDYGTAPGANKGVTSVTAYISALSIGGLIGVDGSSVGVIPIDAIISLLVTAGTSGGRQYTLSASNVTLNGAAQDLAMSPTQVAVLFSIAIAVIGV